MDDEIGAIHDLEDSANFINSVNSGPEIKRLNSVYNIPKDSEFRIRNEEKKHLQ